MSQPHDLSGPDFTKPFPINKLADGVPLLGQVRGEAALLVRRGDAVYAVGAKCTHYGAPLQTGVVTSTGIHCPWHHACFRLQDGQVERSPALNSIASYEVARADGYITVLAKKTAEPFPATSQVPKSVTVVGTGAAAMGAAVRLRELGYTGLVTALGSDAAEPYDRTKLSKGFLGGGVPPASLKLQAGALESHGIQWRTRTTVTKINLPERTLSLAGGGKHPFDALLLAMGARPRTLDVPGGDLPHVRQLRSLDDAVALTAGAAKKPDVVIIGASFIGLEAAQALRARKLTVHVVTPHSGAPMAQVLGEALGQEIRSRHTQAGIVLHSGRTVVRVTPTHVHLDDGQTLAAGLVLAAIGVVPNVEIAQAAGLKVDDGIVVDTHLRTSELGIYAAGDVAAAPQNKTKRPQRIEHWNVAMQMGRLAAANMLGTGESYNTTPFFWTEHQGLKVRYVGHAPKGARTRVYGDVAAGRAAVALFDGPSVAAVITVGCDPVSLACEAALDAGTPETIEPLLTQEFKPTSGP